MAELVTGGPDDEVQADIVGFISQLLKSLTPAEPLAFMPGYEHHASGSDLCVANGLDNHSIAHGPEPLQLLKSAISQVIDLADLLNFPAGC